MKVNFPYLCDGVRFDSLEPGDCFMDGNDLCIITPALNDDISWAEPLEDYYRGEYCAVLLSEGNTGKMMSYSGDCIVIPVDLEITVNKLYEEENQE